MKLVNREEYGASVQDYIGWCTACGDFTRECTEPDARGYDCPDCNRRTVLGAEQALLEGKIAFTEEE